MIRTLTVLDVYNILSAESSITSLANVYSQKPSDEAIQSLSNVCYLWIDIVSDQKNTPSNGGMLMATARVSITVVSKTKDQLGATEVEVELIDDIISAVTNAIVDEGCSKNESWNSCIEGQQSPLLYRDKDRAVRVKDYFISYCT